MQSVQRLTAILSVVVKSKYGNVVAQMGLVKCFSHNVVVVVAVVAVVGFIVTVVVGFTPWRNNISRCD